MGLRGILRTIANDHVGFWCLGCEELHVISIPPHPQAWGFNGDYDKPTFTPSVLTWRDAKKPEEIAPGFEAYLTARRCHSFVTNGSISFLDDCTHDKAGQTHPLTAPLGDRYD